MLSPAIAAAFELYTTTMVCELTDDPESKTPVDPTIPSAGKVHNQPDAAVAVVVDAINPAAV